MTHQTELSLPPRETDELLREKVKAIECEIIAAEARGDLVTRETLYRERKRLKKLVWAAGRTDAGEAF